MKQIALVLAGFVAGTMPLAAQHARHFPPPQPSVQPPTSIQPPRAPIVAQIDARAVMDPLGMMDTMELLLSPALRFTPGSVIEREHELLLTPDQVGQLTEIDQRAAVVRASVMPGYAEHVRQLRETLAGAEPDAAAADGHFQAMQAAMGAAHRAELRAALEAKTVLTAEQRRRVEGMMPSAPAHDGAAGDGHVPRPER